MPIPSDLYGPFGALAALAMVLVLIVRGDLVPGFIYKAEVAQRVKAEAMADANADALAVLAKAAADAHSILVARQAAYVPGPPRDG